MPIDRKYEKFLGGPTLPTQERIYVSLNNDARFILNQNVYRMLGKPEAVFLHFSRADDMIAMEPASPRMPAAFPVKRYHDSQTWVVQAAPFCRHFNIRLDTTERFVSPDISDGALHLKLRETVTVRQLRKKKRS